MKLVLPALCLLAATVLFFADARSDGRRPATCTPRLGAGVPQVRLDLPETLASTAEEGGRTALAGAEPLAMNTTPKVDDLPSGRLLGMVVTPEGLCLPGVEVLAWRLRPGEIEAERPADSLVTTGPNGQFQIEVPAGTCLLEARAPGMLAPTRLLGSCAAGQRVSGLSLVLGPEVLLVGVVRDTAGKGLAGARVRSERTLTRQEDAVPQWKEARVVSSRWWECVADSDGRFSTPVPGETETSLLGECPGFEELHQDGLRAEEASIELVLRAALTVQGEVRDARGAAVPGAEVRLSGRNRRTVSTDARGCFAMNGLSRDAEAMLLVIAEGHAPWWLERCDLEASRVQIELQGQEIVSGLVVDSAGNPLVGALVSLRARPSDGRSAAEEWAWSGERTKATTDSHGRFELPALAERPSLLEAQAKGHVSAEQWLPPGTSEARVALTAAGQRMLRGVVKSLADGSEVHDFRVCIESPSTGVALERAIHDRSGRFALKAEPSAPLSCTVVAPGFVPWRADLGASDGLDAEIRLEPSRALELLVLGPDDRPIEGARVVVRDAHDVDCLMMGPRGACAAQAWTDAGGIVRFDGLPLAPLVALVQVRGSSTLAPLPTVGAAQGPLVVYASAASQVASPLVLR